jgi:hypothetical protein
MLWLLIATFIWIWNIFAFAAQDVDKFAAFKIHLLRVVIPVDFDMLLIYVSYSKWSEEGSD